MGHESILDQCMEHAREEDKTVDYRDGSLLKTALSAAAIEFDAMQEMFDWGLDQCFPDTAEREYLTRMANGRASPYAASSAVLVAATLPETLDVPLGSRFSGEDLNFVVTAKIVDGLYKVTCETPGSAANGYVGRLIPIETIDGLTYAEALDVLILGDDEEKTDHFRARYISMLENPPFGGNRAQYLEMGNSIDGVGGCKPVRAIYGGGTVGLYIQASDYGVPTQSLIDHAQQLIDPDQDGSGIGLAPMDHAVTVLPVAGVPINVTSALTLQSGYAMEDVKDSIQTAISAYLLTLSKTWESTDQLVVRLTGIEQALLSVGGIIDCEQTTVNGAASNLLLGAYEIPVYGGFADGSENT